MDDESIWDYDEKKRMRDPWWWLFYSATPTYLMGTYAKRTSGTEHMPIRNRFKYKLGVFGTFGTINYGFHLISSCFPASQGHCSLPYFRFLLSPFALIHLSSELLPYQRKSNVFQGQVRWPDESKVTGNDGPIIIGSITWINTILLDGQ